MVMEALGIYIKRWKHTSDVQKRIMDRIIRVFCAVILISHICFEVILAHQKFEPAIEAKLKEEDESKIPSIWFSPRLGRKKRNLKDEGYRPTEQEQQELLEAFEDSPLALVAINGNDRLICKNVQGKRSSFIPRLGRNVEEDLSSNDKWLETENSAEYVIQRSPPFAPRLGRRFNPYFPRLGREV
uniref:PBAN-type neuropeptides-like n=1 Tax=Diabrotica virgifera virgifera TaxID=50390 RepID=A0A6P7GIB7_DIAVI